MLQIKRKENNNMRKPHILNKVEFVNYESKHEIAGSYGIDEHKSLIMIANSTSGIKYLVDNKLAKKAEYFLNLEDAIDFYNKY